MPAANTSCDPVPVPVVNEYEDVQSDVERIARQLHGQHQDEPVWGKLDGHKRDDYHLFAARVLQCPSVAAAFEAQAKLEAAEASLRMAHEVLSITTNYLLGQGEGEGRDPDECRALATNEALAGFERLDALLFPKGGV